jgi:hypothetical protein
MLVLTSLSYVAVITWVFQIRPPKRNADVRDEVA